MTDLRETLFKLNDNLNTLLERSAKYAGKGALDGAKVFGLLGGVIGGLVQLGRSLKSAGAISSSTAI
jgi:hypothetical protein